jgi:hypothetical protein
MKRGRFSFFRFWLLTVLTGFFLYSTSVQDIHYMFIHHQVEVNDHCDNHLHAGNNHDNCSLCKIELSWFVQTVEQFYLTAVKFVSGNTVYRLREAVIQRPQTFNSPARVPGIFMIKSLAYAVMRHAGRCITIC